MLQDNFNILVKNMGVSIKHNDEEKKAILTSNINNTQFDDRIIHAPFELQRGDSIEYDGTTYFVISDIQTKRAFEYKAIIRPASQRFTYEYEETERVIIDWDPLGNPIYGEETVIIEGDFPCIIEQDSIPNLNDGQITMLDNRIKVTLQDNADTETIEQGEQYTLLNYTYRVTSINLIETGLRILTMEWTQSSG